MKHVWERLGVLGVAVGVMTALTGCTRWAEPPRYGSLKADPQRPFDYDHRIELFETGNGLRFAVRRDARAGVATIDVRYAAGAAVDPPGRAGLAHLVEHLMFALRPAPGAPTLAAELDRFALDYNAATYADATHYRTTVPVAQLADALALEARRMTAQCDHLADAELERERDVVRAENAQRGAAVRRQLAEAIFGADHPYARPVSSDQIVDATRAEICAFITAHYAPDRAVLVVTGDVDVAAARALIGRTFGVLTRRGAGARPGVPAPPAFTGQEVTITAPVGRPIAAVAVRAPGDSRTGSATFELAAMLLDDRLGRSDARHRWITDRNVAWLGDARVPVLVLALEVSDLGQLDAAYAELYQAIDDVGRYRGSSLLSTVVAAQHLARWDSASQRGERIARYLQHADHNWFVLQDLREIATPWHDAFRLHAPAFAKDATVRVTIRPGAAGTTAPGRALALTERDLHVWRVPVDLAEADRPAAQPPSARVGAALERYQLANGLTVELAPDDDSAMVDLRLVFPVGYAHAAADAPVVPTAAAEFLDFDREGYYSSSELRRLVWATSRGTSVDVAVSARATTFAAAGLYHYADWHLWYLASLIDQGRYESLVVDRARALGRRLAARDADRANIVDEGRRAYLERLYGVGHPFTREPPSTGLAFAQLAVGTLEAWKRAYYRPRGATLIVSGRFDRARMRTVIDELFGPWADVAPAPTPAVPTATPASTASWFAFVDPDARQVFVDVAFAVPPVDTSDAHDVVVEMLTDELRDVREGMAASYGVRAHLATSAQGGALWVDGAVDRGRAGAAARRILDVIARVRTEPAIRRAAFVRARQRLVRAAQDRGAGASVTANRRAAAAAAGQGARPVDDQVARYAQVTLAQVEAILATELDPARQVLALSGRDADLTAAYAELGHEPERFAPAADAPPPPRDDADEPQDPAPTAATPATVALRVGVAPDRRLYHGDRAIGRDEFLRIAGRQDVLDRMRNRLWLRLGMAGLGAAALVGGAIYGWSHSCADDLPAREAEACEAEHSQRRQLGGFTAIGGAALLVTAHYLSNRAPSSDELRDISVDHNTGRRRRSAAAPVVAPVISDRVVGLTVALPF